MDFPTALRYLMAGRTIRRKEFPNRIYRLGTVHETLDTQEEKLRLRDGAEIVENLASFPGTRFRGAIIVGRAMLAEDWEVVDE
jgi:hypothetical protein